MLKYLSKGAANAASVQKLKKTEKLEDASAENSPNTGAR